MTTRFEQFLAHVGTQLPEPDEAFQESLHAAVLKMRRAERDLLERVLGAAQLAGLDMERAYAQRAGHGLEGRIEIRDGLGDEPEHVVAALYWEQRAELVFDLVVWIRDDVTAAYESFNPRGLPDAKRGIAPTS